jgi:hypothetical protein
MAPLASPASNRTRLRRPAKQRALLNDGKNHGSYSTIGTALTFTIPRQPANAVASYRSSYAETAGAFRLTGEVSHSYAHEIDDRAQATVFRRESSAVSWLRELDQSEHRTAMSFPR